jgi:hypothetical protein
VGELKINGRKNLAQEKVQRQTHVNTYEISDSTKCWEFYQLNNYSKSDEICH